jgi:peroxin-12
LLCACVLTFGRGRLAFVALGARTHSPLLALMRMRLVRARLEDVQACAARSAAARRAAIDAASSGRVGALRVMLLQSCFGVVDAARPGLVAAVLGFKVLEWWFSTAEAALAPSQRLPVPPPPPPLPLAPGGLPLPADVRACPICLRPRTNAAVAAPSGIAFCFPCLRTALDSNNGLCPVTGVPVGADQVRRLFETAV